MHSALYYPIHSSFTFCNTAGLPKPLFIGLMYTYFISPLVMKITSSLLLISHLPFKVQGKDRRKSGSSPLMTKSPSIWV
nr:MAG TPA: hypothetical protein [Bacteriophage sp.]